MPQSGLLRPWRSARLGWAATALALIVGVPLFLAMPPWTDATLYDVAARNLLRGGTHYRDVFDTNLPGMVWATAAIRSMCGWSFEALRGWDLLIVGGCAIALLNWLKRADANGAARAWFAAGAALFYPFTSEFNHCQRDPWMLLPALLATALRLGQVERIQRGEPASIRHSFVEGLLWGLAVWLKPHALIPAAAVWTFSAMIVKRSRGRDFVGVIGGGLIGGIPGIAWLIASGTWPHFWDIATRWNPEYLREGVWQEIPHKLAYLFWCFQPWGLVHLAAMPIAVLSLRKQSSPRSHALRGLTATTQSIEPRVPTQSVGTRNGFLAALYLGWVVQASFLQKGFEYVQVPPMLLALAIVASRGWSVGFPFLAWYLALGIVSSMPSIKTAILQFNATSRSVQIERHPLTNPRIVGLWPRCFQESGSPELRNALGQYTHVHCATNWQDLDAAAQFLRTVEPPIRDRELTGWHDSTHPLYLLLDVEPSTRYMHFGTAFALRGKADEIRAEVMTSPQRYAVSDLRRMTHDLGKAYAPGEFGPLSLPAWFPQSQRGQFPWNQPIVFRSGRYAVHRIDRAPIAEEIDIPDWNKLQD